MKVKGMRPSPTDPFYTEVQGQSREALRRQFTALRDKGAKLVNLLANASEQWGLLSISPQIKTSLL